MSIARDELKQDDNIIMNEFMTLLREKSGKAALDFYNDNKEKYFKTKKQFKTFFSIYAELPGVHHIVHGEFYESLYNKIFKRLMDRVQTKNNKVIVAMKLADLL